MKDIFFGLKKNEKGLFKTLLDDHRDVAIHRRAMKEMLLFLLDEKISLPYYEEEHIINEVFNRIAMMKERLQKLEDAQNNSSGSCNNSPNP